MDWRITLIVAFLMPYLARIPGMFTRGPEWLWSYIPSPGAFFFFSAFNLIALAPLAILGFLSARYGLSGAFLLTTIVYGAATYSFHHGYDLAADAQAALGLIAIPLIIGGITLLVALIASFAEVALT